jgi:hypothetical protein
MPVDAPPSYALATRRAPLSAKIERDRRYRATLGRRRAEDPELDAAVREAARQRQARSREQRRPRRVTAPRDAPRDMPGPSAPRDPHCTTSSPVKDLSQNHQATTTKPRKQSEGQTALPVERLVLDGRIIRAVTKRRFARLAHPELIRNPVGYLLTVEADVRRSYQAILDAYEGPRDDIEAMADMLEPVVRMPRAEPVPTPQEQMLAAQRAIWRRNDERRACQPEPTRAGNLAALASLKAALTSCANGQSFAKVANYEHRADVG